MLYRPGHLSISALYSAAQDSLVDTRARFTVSWPFSPDGHPPGRSQRFRDGIHGPICPALALRHLSRYQVTR
jgi:hypothetical protein